MTGPEDCSMQWCHEAGEHTEHRRYLLSLPVWHGAWLVGVNLVQPVGRPVRIEMTISPRHGAGVTLPLASEEARVLGEALHAATVELGGPRYRT